MKLDLRILLIFILIGVIIFINTCSNENKNNKKIIKIDGKKYEVVKNKVDTQYVNIEKVVFKTGETIYRDTTIFVPTPLSIDTLNILKDFFSKNVFKDTLKLDDSLGIIVIIDTITNNTISKRRWYVNLNKTIIRDETIVKELTKNQIYFGFNTNINKIDIVGSVGFAGTLRTREDRMYNLSIGLTNTTGGVSPYIGGGIQWKLKLNK